MKVLFALSQVQITGAETHALTLAQSLQDLGHEVVFVSDELHEPHPFRFLPLPLHRKNTSYAGRIQNIFSLRGILERENVDLIHSHSRAANLAAHFAAREFPSRKFPYAATVHGRWRNTFAFRSFPCLGRMTIAMCPYLQRYLAEDIGIPSENIEMIPNSVNTERFSPALEQPDHPVILYIGRFTGQKGNALRFLLKKVVGEVMNLFPDARLKILADEPSKEDLGIVNGLNGGMDFLKAVEIVPPPEKLEELYRGATAVIGAGRVVLEAMACGKPVISIGESSAPGLMSPESFDGAFDSNFGDCGEWNLFKGRETRLIGDLEKVLKDPSLRENLSGWGRNLILSRFDAKAVAPRVVKVYERARSLH